jgi:hypothetical protein
VGLFVPERTSSTIDVPVVGTTGRFRVTTTLSQSLYFGIVGLGWRARPELALGVSLAAVYLSSVALRTPRPATATSSSPCRSCSR